LALYRLELRVGEYRSYRARHLPRLVPGRPRHPNAQLALPAVGLQRTFYLIVGQRPDFAKPGRSLQLMPDCVGEGIALHYLRVVVHQELRADPVVIAVEGEHYEVALIGRRRLPCDEPGLGLITEMTQSQHEH